MAFYHAAQQGLADVVSAVYPDDFGIPLLQTCKEFFGNENLNRAAWLTALYARKNFSALAIRSNNIVRFEAIARLVGERPPLHVCQNSGEHIGFAVVRHGQYELLPILARAGFDLTVRQSAGATVFSVVCEKSNKDPRAAVAAVQLAEAKEAKLRVPPELLAAVPENAACAGSR